MLRQQVPIFDHKVFINSCSKGALTQPVRQAYLQYLAEWECLGSPWELWVGKLERVRGQFAALVGAVSDEIAVCTSVSAAVSALASALDFSGTRNKVVVDDFSFPAVAQVWHAQEPRGAEVVHVPAAGNTIPLEHYAARIDERTPLSRSATSATSTARARMSKRSWIWHIATARWCCSTPTSRWARCPSTSRRWASIF